MSIANRSIVALSALLLATSAHALPLAHDQSNLSEVNGFFVSSAVAANDFVVSGRVRITAAEVWLQDGEFGDNGDLESFNGTLSWAIYKTSVGNVPGDEVAVGKALRLVERDAFLQDEFDHDVFAVRFELEPPVTLSTGTYWFALHEGTWGSAGDGSEVHWAIATGSRGNPAASSPDEQNQGSWNVGSGETAFVLFGGDPAWDQSLVLSGLGGQEVTQNAVANELLVEVPGSFSTIEVWIDDLVENDDGVVSSFGGQLGWAIYTDVANEPGAQIDTGLATPAVIDTGLQSDLGSDRARAKLALGRNVQLTPGYSWLALHEGTWLGPGDGTPIRWAFGAKSFEDPLMFGASQNPDWQPGATDAAFVLSHDPVFASGFESGTYCGWASAAGLDCY